MEMSVSVCNVFVRDLAVMNVPTAWLGEQVQKCDSILRKSRGKKIIEMSSFAR